jgi:hypothetical protein
MDNNKRNKFMKCMATILIFLFSCYKTQIVRPSEAANLYIIAGQSNCGRPEWPGTGQTGDPATTSQLFLYDDSISGFEIFNPGYDTDGFHTCKAGLNTLLFNPLHADEMGPEVSLLWSLKRSGEINGYLIKYGVGNTYMSQWLSYGGQESYLEYCVSRAVELIKAKGQIPTLKAFIWMQGENDACDSLNAAAYYGRLTTFFNRFDSFYKIPYKKIIGRINGSEDKLETYRDVVRKAQENYCSANNAVLINTDSYPLFGGVHYTATGQIKFGTDIFNALK